jgi:hypothetical protein
VTGEAEMMSSATTARETDISLGTAEKGTTKSILNVPIIGGDPEADQAAGETTGETTEDPEGATEEGLAEADQYLAAEAEEVAETTEERDPPDPDQSQAEEPQGETDPATRGRDLRALEREEGATAMGPTETEERREVLTTTLPSSRTKKSELITFPTREI